jgi:hypothetical protein
MMTEHGPRIYIDNFRMFAQLLEDMGTSFHDLFVKYNFSTATMMAEALRVLSPREMATLFWSFVTLNDSFKKITLMEYLSSHAFSRHSGVPAARGAAHFGPARREPGGRVRTRVCPVPALHAVLALHFGDFSLAH